MSDQEVEQLRNRVSRLEDQIEHVYTPKIEDQRERIDELEATMEDLAAQVEGVNQRVSSVIDADGRDDSSPPKRAAALREALIRACGDSAGSLSGGVTWWWKEVRDQLASHGHGDFSKPVYHDAMKDAAELDGFEQTTKFVITGGQKREVNAIAVDPSKVTAADLRNQLTTRDGQAGGGVGAATDGGAVKTEEME